QLRRDVRAQHRAAGHPARPECALEGRRADVRPAGALRNRVRPRVSRVPPARPRQSPRRLNLRSETLRGWLWQIALLAAVAAVLAWLVGNTLDNLAARGIQVGFGFLGQEAGFAISQTPVPYRPGDTYARALVTGLANTLIVSAIGIVVATLLGTAIGVARLAGNRLLAGLAGAYVEAVRNVPLLLQLFVWYGVLTEWLPPVRQAVSLGGVLVLSQR